MGADVPKVLLPLCGRPMLAYILDALAEVGVSRLIVVVGKGGEQVKEAFGEGNKYVRQEEQLGSGHAVLCARESARGSTSSPQAGSSYVLVMCGDSPLFRTETIRSLMNAHVREHAAVSLASAILEDPRGYGRIIRGTDGEIAGIVEEKLATDAQKTVKEINGGCYAFDAEWLWANIEALTSNEAGEYCLTEMVDIALAQDRRVIAVSAAPDEVAGVNTPSQLKDAEKIIRSRGAC